MGDNTNINKLRNFFGKSFTVDQERVLCRLLCINAGLYDCLAVQVVFMPFMGRVGVDYCALSLIAKQGEIHHLACSSADPNHDTNPKLNITLILTLTVLLTVTNPNPNTNPKLLQWISHGAYSKLHSLEPSSLRTVLYSHQSNSLSYIIFAHYKGAISDMPTEYQK